MKELSMSMFVNEKDYWKVRCEQAEERLKFITTDYGDIWRTERQVRHNRSRYRMIKNGVNFGKWYQTVDEAIDAANVLK